MLAVAAIHHQQPPSPTTILHPPSTVILHQPSTVNRRPTSINPFPTPSPPPLPSPTSLQVDLDPICEELATFYALVPDDGPQLGDPTTAKIFQDNFFKDFKKVENFTTKVDKILHKILYFRYLDYIGYRIQDIVDSVTHDHAARYYTTQHATARHCTRLHRALPHIQYAQANPNLPQPTRPIPPHPTPFHPLSRLSVRIT